MIIKFTKGDMTSPGKISCTRRDGSYTSASIHAGIELHDIIHYAVESTLKFKQGFYGLLDQGYQIEDFIAPRDTRPTALIPANLPVEAIQSEFLVNQLMMETLQGHSDDFMDVFKKTLDLSHVAFPDSLNQISLKEIRDLIQSIKNQWSILEEGKSMELTF